MIQVHCLLNELTKTLRLRKGTVAIEISQLVSSLRVSENGLQLCFIIRVFVYVNVQIGPPSNKGGQKNI